MTPETNSATNATTPEQLIRNLLNTCATDSAGPVALHVRQRLVPVEQVEASESAIIFPPTYADIGYNIDTLSDGTKVATIDSVGSQANRLEPIFRSTDKDRKNWLVPQIMIALSDRPCGQCEDCKDDKKKCKTPYKEKRSLLDLAHRSADAVVQSSPKLAPSINQAFEALRRNGNAGPLCAWAPTSLIFGVWDSRGGTGEKRPRLVRSVIRAWNVEPLHSAAQFNSTWKSLTEDQQKDLEERAKQQKVKLSTKGFADAPAVFRKVSQKAEKYMNEFKEGAPNPDRRVLGGVRVLGRIEREVTVNLVALRGICGQDGEESKAIRKYLLALSLVAATAEIDQFLREGCHLRFGEKEDVWYQVPRRGDPTMIPLGTADARKAIATIALEAAEPFKKKWATDLDFDFDIKEAKKLLAKKGDDDESEQA